MDDERYWLGFVAANGERRVEPFGSYEEAMIRREKLKRYWGTPARITIAYQAVSEIDALEKLDLY